MAGRARLKLRMSPMGVERRPPRRPFRARDVLVILGGAALVVAGLMSALVVVSLARAESCDVASPLSVPAAGSRLPATSVNGHPSSIASTADGNTLFVSLTASDAGETNGLQIFHRDSDGLHQVGIIPLHSAVAGVAISPDGKLLLAALEDRVAVLDLARAASGDPSGLLGYVPTSMGAGSGPMVVAGRYVITADRKASQLTVLDLPRLEAGDLGPAVQVAKVDVDLAPTGLAASPDGRYLYVTSQVQGPLIRLAPTDFVYGALTSVGLPQRAGTLAVIDLQRVEVNPDGSVLARTAAGCDPAQVAVAPDGRTVWVTARESNELLAFRTDSLLAGNAPAPAARVAVGAAPVPVRVVDDGRYALVADTRLTGDTSAPESLVVVDTAAALTGRPALRSQLQVGGLPRDIGVTADQHTAYVTNSGSSSVTSLDLSTLPR